MRSDLRQRLERLGPVRDVSRVTTGSPAIIAIQRTPDAGLKAVSATTALAKRGVSLLEAKCAIEEMIAKGRAVVTLPIVEDTATLTRHMADCGVSAADLS